MWHYPFGPLGELLVQLANGHFYRLDQRLELIDNTLENPAETASAYLTYQYGCPNVPKTFLNAATCVQVDSCAPISYSTAPLHLNETVLREWYTRSNKVRTDSTRPMHVGTIAASPTVCAPRALHSTCTMSVA